MLNEPCEPGTVGNARRSTPCMAVLRLPVALLAIRFR
jgi:hypothetical protein